MRLGFVEKKKDASRSIATYTYRNSVVNPPQGWPMFLTSTTPLLYGFPMNRNAAKLVKKLRKICIRKTRGHFELTGPFGVKVFICKALNTKKVSVALKKYQKVEKTMRKVMQTEVQLILRQNIFDRISEIFIHDH